MQNYPAGTILSQSLPAILAPSPAPPWEAKNHYLRLTQWFLVLKTRLPYGLPYKPSCSDEVGSIKLATTGPSHFLPLVLVPTDDVFLFCLPFLFWARIVLVLDHCNYCIGLEDIRQ